MNRDIQPATSISGSLRVPADKSIAHRAAIFAAIATGSTRLTGYPRGADTMSTVHCLSQLGVESSWDGETLVIHGRGLLGLRKSRGPLHCGNSGTTMRLLTGLLSAQDFDSELTGDDSLLRRPMERVAQPLRAMGASISLSDGRAPIRIRGNGPLSPISHTLTVPFAQVKSAIILGALTASGQSVIHEPSPSRDHTERMLNLTIGIESGIRTIVVTPLDKVDASNITIPGDFSSAAFFIVGASIVPESDLLILGVGVNPTRTGLLEVLRNAGASIECSSETSHAEPTADIRVQSSDLQALTISDDIVPRLVDEVPILAVAATQARGQSVFSGIGELRAKESDRIETTTQSLTRLGGVMRADANSMTIHGATKLTGQPVESSGDHRIAMAMAIAGLVAEGGTTIHGAESASVSYPGFWDDLESVAGR